MVKCLIQIVVVFMDFNLNMFQLLYDTCSFYAFITFLSGDLIALAKLRETITVLCCDIKMHFIIAIDRCLIISAL